MKKAFVVLLIAALIMGTSMNVFASPMEKDVQVSIFGDAKEIRVGETLELTAVSVKYGSDYSDYWIGAENKVTVQDSYTGNYRSTAEFVADKPGVYTVTYGIHMAAGKSNTVFSGQTVYFIKVVGDVEVAGADIRDLTIRPIIRPDGSISAYSAQGSIFIQWSDNTSTLYGTVFFNYGVNELVKDVKVTFIIEGIPYSYLVPVEREEL